ncbi:MAG: MGMT family protein [Clostridia bacterium]|nr:MGMT family protein [Clostridia bacterium]
MNTFDLIYDAVKRIPKGRVATYGQIAKHVGNPRYSRVVGFALHVNPDPKNIPCHRVVNRFGKPSSAFAFGGENMQIRLLENEGVTFTDGCVDLKKHLWRPEHENADD